MHLSVWNVGLSRCVYAILHSLMHSIHFLLNRGQVFVTHPFVKKAILNHILLLDTWLSYIRSIWVYGLSVSVLECCDYLSQFL